MNYSYSETILSATFMVYDQSVQIQQIIRQINETQFILRHSKIMNNKKRTNETKRKKHNLQSSCYHSINQFGIKWLEVGVS